MCVCFLPSPLGEFLDTKYELKGAVSGWYPVFTQAKPDQGPPLLKLPHQAKP